ncbi:MAG: hypothetical protein JWL73_1457 [Actinomycetia bacterium]|nr:hypothetical protein [Actinomycetes bacterium]
MIGYRLERARWLPADAGVYRAATTPASWNLTVMAACLAGPAVASHRAAARIWGLPGFSQAPAEVTAYRHRRRKPAAVVWHESFFLEGSRDTTTLDGIGVTSATRTIIDLSSVVPSRDVEIALDDACHRGLTSLASVGKDLERLRRRFGTTDIRAVLELKISEGSPSAESPLESRAAIILRDSGLPRATPQFEIIDGSQFVARVDFAWPDHRVVLEVDSVAFHADRCAWERDLARQSRLAAAGWRVHRVTHQALNDPAGIVGDLRRSLCVS